MKPYEDYTKKFNEAFVELIKITPTINSVNDLKSEDDELRIYQSIQRTDANKKYSHCLC
jgi:type I restriction enzyme R subunit